MEGEGTEPTILQGGSTALWRDLVQDGEARSATTLDEEIEAYLVFALMRHLGDASLLRRTMALELLDAMDGTGRSRREGLREVGDRCLLIAGLFPRLAARRRVSPRYFSELGRGAYAHVADAAREREAGLFGRLARAFDPMVAVLSHAVAVVQGETRPCIPQECRALLVGQAHAGGPLH